MAQAAPFWRQRPLWTVVVALAALAFWVAGIASGWRGWILSANDGGVVAHAQAFGDTAFVWWIPASVLTLTAVVMGIGTALVRHLVDGPVAAKPALEPKPEKKPLSPKKPIDPKPSPEAADSGSPSQGKPSSGNPDKPGPPKDPLT